jgi:hypothetical protein
VNTQMTLFGEQMSTAGVERTGQAKERDRKVLKVLQDAAEPLGPTEIARRVGEEWCAPKGGYPLSAAITPICRRLGLPSVRGKYSAPKVES